SGWVEAEGELTAGPGTMSASLMQALKSQMNFRIPPRVLGRAGDLTFGALGLTFAMTRDGEIRFGGALGTEYQPDAVVVDAQRLTPLAFAPQGAANVLGLVNTLIPKRDDRVLVAGGRESQSLQRCLPLPSSGSGRPESIGSN